MSEKISRLVDRDLDTQTLNATMTDLSQSSEAKHHWQQYHLIGSVIRGEIDSVGNDLGARIGAALEAEPTMLAPVWFASTESNENASQEADAVPIWKSAGMLAIAASVALVAVTTLKPNDGIVPAGGPVAAVNSVDQSTVASSAADREHALFEQELGEMMSNHGEFSASAGLNGLVTYAKLVSAEQLSR